MQIRLHCAWQLLTKKKGHEMEATRDAALATIRRCARKEDEPRYVIGLDAHSKVLAISVWDWSDRLNPVLCADFRSVNIDALSSTYERHVDPDSITIVEASTNSAAIKRELNEIGFRAEIVRSDTIAGKESSRKVCDIQDARNLAKAYMKGDVEEFIWTPSPRFGGYREIVHAYRDSGKDLKRLSNRMWNICSQNRLPLPPRNSAAKVEHMQSLIEARRPDDFVGRRMQMMLDDYTSLLKRNRDLDEMMAEIVAADKGMLRLLQLPGINYKAAFVTWAAVEDPMRFPTASKLAAYGGLSPSKNTSGDEELRAAMRGGTGKPLDHEGRRDLKFFYTEAGLTVLTTCAKTVTGKWGWRLINGGKPKLKVMCAIGHKLLTYAWHIMRGDPTPNRDSEIMFKNKIIRLGRVLGDAKLKKLGYSKTRDFADKVAKEVYSNLPE